MSSNAAVMIMQFVQYFFYFLSNIDIVNSTLRIYNHIKRTFFKPFFKYLSAGVHAAVFREFLNKGEFVNGSKRKYL